MPTLSYTGPFPFISLIELIRLYLQVCPCVANRIKLFFDIFGETLSIHLICVKTPGACSHIQVQL